jgi:hypothetical protein
MCRCTYLIICIYILQAAGSYVRQRISSCLVASNPQITDRFRNAKPGRTHGPQPTKAVLPNCCHLLKSLSYTSNRSHSPNLIIFSFKLNISDIIKMLCKNCQDIFDQPRKMGPQRDGPSGTLRTIITRHRISYTRQ